MYTSRIILIGLLFSFLGCASADPQPTHTPIMLKGPAADTPHGYVVSEAWKLATGPEIGRCNFWITYPDAPNERELFTRALVANRLGGDVTFVCDPQTAP